jgi:hypothetical protein
VIFTGIGEGCGCDTVGGRYISVNPARRTWNCVVTATLDKGTNLTTGIVQYIQYSTTQDHFSKRMILDPVILQ